MITDRLLATKLHTNHSNNTITITANAANEKEYQKHPEGSLGGSIL